ncbi:hypothetical protein SK069_09735 [Patulibacter brassicae]|uniref:Uncharacterized protein n=1 Tax=Patulibacter brassicae TaxID=1705717 RepID=A0ABU4VJ97_9ACTN|nr:hypothetical protein [Patulibacter brassicae]MDX8151873.1 hypothetical protein [Patulibacter brassicae]
MTRHHVPGRPLVSGLGTTEESREAERNALAVAGPGSAYADELSALAKQAYDEIYGRAEKDGRRDVVNVWQSRRDGTGDELVGRRMVAAPSVFGAAEDDDHDAARELRDDVRRARRDPNQRTRGNTFG